MAHRRVWIVDRHSVDVVQTGVIAQEISQRRRVGANSWRAQRYIAAMSTRGKPQLVEIEEQLLRMVKEEAQRRGITYRAFFEAGLRAELQTPTAFGPGQEELRIA